jgi:GNAT superfamily N-acetyltransferase
MIEVRREPPDGPAARALWDEYMALTRERLGDDFRPTEAIFGSTEDLDAWLVVYEDGAPVACGGLRELEPATGEIKRMFVTAGARGRGHGRRLLGELETLAAAAGHRRIRLLTTEVLVEALALYSSAGYAVVSTFRIEGRTDYWLEKPLDSGFASVS